MTTQCPPGYQLSPGGALLQPTGVFLVDASGNPVVPPQPGTPTAPITTGGLAAVIAATAFARPADTTAYAIGDLVANNTTAGSVTPLTFTAVGRVAGSGGMIRRVRFFKSTATITNAAFRLHLYTLIPTVTNGDNGAFLSIGGAPTTAALYMGALDIPSMIAFSDGASGIGAPLVGSEINFSVQNCFGLIEARGAYAPGNAETFQALLEVIPN